ncbi:hypothetical protein MMC17_010232 [Xylographa soralifera]|nr:hypothetical protein [Xylographa soralifera]
MGILDGVPDLIREAALKGGVLNVGTNTPGSFGAVPPDLRQAYIDGNYSKIQEYNNKTSNDLNPIYGNIQNHAEKAFVQVINPSNNTPYWLSIAGPANKPYGYMWTYVAPTTTSSEAGSSSNNAGGTSAHNQWLSSALSLPTQTHWLWDNSLAQLGVGAIATIVMTTVSKYIKNRITGALVGDAADAAIADAGAELVAEAVVAPAVWITVTGFIGGLVVGAVVGAIVFFLIMYIINFVYKAYKVAFNIYNWDLDHDYIINSQYTGDNAVLDGDQAFEATSLPTPSNYITMPDGLKVPTADTIYQYASFIYDNGMDAWYLSLVYTGKINAYVSVLSIDSKFFQGLGAALTIVQADSTTGFGMKYDCPRFDDNRLGLKGGIIADAEQFYKDGDSWAASGSYSTQITLPITGVPISCTTTALSGRDDQFYQLDVHIGLKPSGNFDKPGSKPPGKTPLLPIPEDAIVPKKGQLILMPGGKKVEVVGNLTDLHYENKRTFEPKYQRERHNRSASRPDEGTH